MTPQATKRLTPLTRERAVRGVRVIWVDPGVPEWVGITGTVVDYYFGCVDVKVDLEHRVWLVGRRESGTSLDGYSCQRWALLDTALEDTA